MREFKRVTDENAEIERAKKVKRLKLGRKSEEGLKEEQVEY